MLKFIAAALLLLSILLSSCHSGGNDAAAPNSEIKILASPGGAVVSTAADRGAITLNVGAQRHYAIQRTLRSTGVPDSTTDVTGNSDFNFSNPDVAAIDANGTLTALASGFTTLEVVYRDGDNDPTDNDKVYLDITVLPNT